VERRSSTSRILKSILYLKKEKIFNLWMELCGIIQIEQKKWKKPYMEIF
jgi:hypothetical protein